MSIFFFTVSNSCLTESLMLSIVTGSPRISSFCAVVFASGRTIQRMRYSPSPKPPAKIRMAKMILSISGSQSR